MEAIISESVSIGEIVKLAAIDNSFFASTFFPKTARQSAPPAHKKIWDALDNPHIRFGNIRAFRGSAKTTILRMFTAKRVAYSLSRTILYVGASEPHAVRSIQWLRNQVDRNPLFRETFKLRRGATWTDSLIEIINSSSGQDESIWILGVGITSNIRGINFDDYRPDLIILDDVVTDENALTGEQRGKLNDLILGAVMNSLAARVEFPNAKMILLQTPIHPEDASSLAMNDPQFTTVVVPCWTDETLTLTLDKQVSAWEEMYPTADLRKNKLAAIQRNKLSLFSREMECRIMRVENASFRSQWLQFYDVPPKGGKKVLGIDPVPPATDRQIAKGLIGKDFEAHVVMGRYQGSYYLHEYVTSKDHTPAWSVTNALSMAHRHKVSAIVVEAVAYQRTLKWMLEAEMKKVGIFFPVIAYQDRRPKFNRITSAYSGIASQGSFYLNPQLHGDFINDFSSYPGVDHDDLLDAGAIALSELFAPLVDHDDNEFDYDDRNVPSIRTTRSAP
jgi:predicted phage terminase large subunit-like protein